MDQSTQEIFDDLHDEAEDGNYHDGVMLLSWLYKEGSKIIPDEMMRQLLIAAKEAGGVIGIIEH